MEVKRDVNFFAGDQNESSKIAVIDRLPGFRPIIRFLRPQRGHPSGGHGAPCPAAPSHAGQNRFGSGFRFRKGIRSHRRFKNIGDE
jgi:hypothetical protein